MPSVPNPPIFAGDAAYGSHCVPGLSPVLAVDLDQSLSEEGFENDNSLSNSCYFPQFETTSTQ
jgi:hypothetical protein